MSAELMALPMREAIEFWRNKVSMTRDEFDEVAEQMQARGFYVSGLTQIDQVEAVKSAIDAAIADGETFDQWKARITDIIDQQKWSGVRLEIIFRTNVQSAYMAGRYAQMNRPAVKKARPFWRYSAVHDRRTRPTHRAMDGKIFPADHPVWDVWYPPNGYRCRCGVQSLSQREITRDGLVVETEDPTGKLIEPVSADGRKMPARPLMPDNGFSRNVGKEWMESVPAPSENKPAGNVPLPELVRDLREKYRGALGI